jgi:hypothetical protein
MSATTAASPTAKSPLTRLAELAYRRRGRVVVAWIAALAAVLAETQDLDPITLLALYRSASAVDSVQARDRIPRATQSRPYRLRLST